MIYELPWFPAVLSPNRPGSWRKKQSAMEKYREDCRLAALSYPRPDIKGNVHLKIIFCPPSNHRRDLDNCLSSVKRGLDSLAKVWGIDDSQFRPITIDFGDKTKGGKIKIEIIS